MILTCKTIKIYAGSYDNSDETLYILLYYAQFDKI